MTRHEILTAARERITPRERWTQGALKREDGSMCAIGSIVDVMGGSLASEGRWTPAMDAIQGLSEAIPSDTHSIYGGNPVGNPVASYNNTHSHQEVLAWFDQAIDNCAPLTVPTEWELVPA